MDTAIVACGAVTALGWGIKPLEEAIRTNSSGLRPNAVNCWKACPPIIAGWVPEEVFAQLRSNDPEHAEARAFSLAYAALKQLDKSLNGLSRSVPPSRRGFVLSTTKADIEVLENAVDRKLVVSKHARHLFPAFLAKDLAEACGVGGAVRCISSACVSGLLAIKSGSALIRRGLADLVLVAGVDLISKFVITGFTSLASMDPTGCRPFDKSRQGLSLGEGAGAMLLVRQDLAPFPAPLVIGSGSSNDANHLTGPSRDGGGLALAIRRALTMANMSPKNIDYINAHGTGTLFNDAMEAAALRTVFGDRVPPVSASKGVFGHTLGAAGVLETILCVIAMRIGVLPGTPRLQNRDPIMPESILNDPRSTAGLHRILKINSGFGGTNAALVLQSLSTVAGKP